MLQLFLSLIAVAMLAAPDRASAQACEAPEPVCAVAEDVVLVSGFEPIGSAVVLDDDLLVTNRHIVADLDTVRVTLADGTAIRANVVPTDFPGDLILLDAPGVSPRLRRDVADANMDTTLYTVGFDVGREAVRVYAPGQLIAPKAETPLARWHHDARSLPGNSGGALVNANGRLVGIVASGGEGRNEAIPASALSDLRASSGQGQAAASQAIGDAYRRCVLSLDDARNLPRGMAPEDADILMQDCLDTNNRQLMDLAGQTLGMRRYLERATTVLETAVDIDPNAPNALISLAVTHSLTQNYAASAPVLRHGLTFLPSDPQLLRLALQAGLWGGDQELADLALARIERDIPQMAPFARRFYDDPPPPPTPR